MGYVGGLGAGQGWHTFKVLPDVSLLREISSFDNVITFTSRAAVPRKDPYLTVDQLCKVYAEVLEAWKHGKENLRLQSYDVMFDIAAPSNRPSLHATSDSNLVVLRTRLPVVDFFSGFIDVDDKARLRSNVGLGFWMGLHVTYPKCYCNEETRWELISTDGFPELAIYQEICRKGKEATRPLVLTHSQRKIRTPIRYSPSLAPHIEQALSHCPWPLRLATGR